MTCAMSFLCAAGWVQLSSQEVMCHMIVTVLHGDVIILIFENLTFILKYFQPGDLGEDVQIVQELVKTRGQEGENA